MNEEDLRDQEIERQKTAEWMSKQGSITKVNNVAITKTQAEAIKKVLAGNEEVPSKDEFEAQSQFEERMRTFSWAVRGTRKMMNIFGEIQS